MVKLGWKKQARDAFEKFDTTIQRRIINKLQEIREDALHYPHQSLRGNLAGNFGFRVGVYRIIYTYKDNLLIVQSIRRRDKGYG